LSGAVRSSPRLTVPLSSWKRARRSRGPRRARSFQSTMSVGRADTPASDGLLAATLLALGDDGYRSEVDAAVSAARAGLIAQILSSTTVAERPRRFRSDPGVQTGWADSTTTACWPVRAQQIATVRLPVLRPVAGRFGHWRRFSIWRFVGASPIRAWLLLPRWRATQPRLRRQPSSSTCEVGARGCVGVGLGSGSPGGAVRD
jgi:hypothetical protein